MANPVQVNEDEIPWGEKPHGATHYYTGSRAISQNRWRRVVRDGNKFSIWAMGDHGDWSSWVGCYSDQLFNCYVPGPAGVIVPHETPMQAPTGKPEILTDIKDITQDIVEFLDQVYPDRSLDSLIKKLKEEMGELEREPLNGWEMADVLIVLFDLCDMAGFDIAKLIHHKMQINRQRKWHIKDGVLHHVADR